MNILVDTLPTSLEVEGKEYKIDSDFRACLRTILAFEDAELAGLEKSLILYNSLFVEKPDNVSEALKQGVWFLNMGSDEVDDSNGPRVFSWWKDASLIYAAFQQTHGIDLESVEYMHWWKFLALFMDLGSGTVFCSLVGLRKRVKTGKASKEERATARELGAMFIVPEIDDRTPDEIEAERAFMSLIKARKEPTNAV
jgi:hypothetical protein